MKPKRPIKIAKQPIYPGGRKVMHQFIMDNLVFPKEAKENNIEGYVVLKYDINYKGDVIKTKIIKSLGYGCDVEAQRLVRLLKFEVPKSRQLKVIFHKNMRIPFKIEKKKPQKSIVPEANYQYTLSNKLNKDKLIIEKKNESNIYSYTITIEKK